MNKNTPMILSVIALVAVIVLGILHFTGGCKANTTVAGTAAADSVKAVAGSVTCRPSPVGLSPRCKASSFM